MTLHPYSLVQPASGCLALKDARKLELKKGWAAGGPIAFLIVAYSLALQHISRSRTVIATHHFRLAVAATDDTKEARTMYDLLYAAAVGDEAVARRCIERSKKASFLWGDLMRTCGRGRTALHYAVLGGHEATALCLIDAGAQPYAAG